MGKNHPNETSLINIDELSCVILWLLSPKLSSKERFLESSKWALRILPATLSFHDASHLQSSFRHQKLNLHQWALRGVRAHVILYRGWAVLTILKCQICPVTYLFQAWKPSWIFWQFSCASGTTSAPFDTLQSFVVDNCPNRFPHWFQLNQLCTSSIKTQESRQKSRVSNCHMCRQLNYEILNFSF